MLHQVTIGIYQLEGRINNQILLAGLKACPDMLNNTVPPHIHLHTLTTGIQQLEMIIYNQILLASLKACLDMFNNTVPLHKHCSLQKRLS